MTTRQGNLLGALALLAIFVVAGCELAFTGSDKGTTSTSAATTAGATTTTGATSSSSGGMCPEFAPTTPGCSPTCQMFCQSYASDCNGAALSLTVNEYGDAANAFANCCAICASLPSMATNSDDQNCRFMELNSADSPAQRCARAGPFGGDTCGNGEPQASYCRVCGKAWNFPDPLDQANGGGDIVVAARMIDTNPGSIDCQQARDCYCTHAAKNASSLTFSCPTYLACKPPGG